MRQGNDGLKEIAKASLKQLEQVVQLPPHEDLWKMSTIDYKYYQDRIADAIEQYRGHTERGLDDLATTAKGAKRSTSQLNLGTADAMNEAYLQFSDEKSRIVLADNRLAHEGMEHISTMMSSLQQSLLQRHEVLAANMNPIDSPRIAESIRKLKLALQELHTRNAQLVMRNEKLNLQLSFMPPKMWNVIVQAARKHSHFYEQQRTDPHHLHLSVDEYRFLRSEPGGIVADRMQRCATVTSVQDLLLEAEDVLAYLKSHDGIVDEPINDDEPCGAKHLK
jgi:hypothetical protein